MSIDSLTSYNPNNVNDTLYAYQSNRTVATNPIQQAPRTNYASTVSLDTPPDTFELSAESKIKNNKDKGMSTGMKALLWIGGTAATVYGCVVGHRILKKPSFESIQKNLSDILGKNLNKEETEKILSKYKNICENSNLEEFLNKLFAEVKKDCGYENLDLALKIEKLKDGSFKTFKEHSTNGSTGCVNKEITIFPKTAHNSLSRGDRKQLFGTMWHEFKHVKQCEQAYRSDANALIDAYVSRLEKNHPEFIEELMKENKYTREQALKDIHEDIGKNLESLFGKYKKYAKGSPEYNKGLEYIANERNYKHEGQEYFDQIVEKEAFEIGDKARPIFDYLANPFKIF